MFRPTAPDSSAKRKLAPNGVVEAPLPQAVVCANISESVVGCSAKARRTQVPQLWHRNSLFPRMDSFGKLYRRVPPDLCGFVVTLGMNYAPLSQHLEPPRTRSAERRSECLHRSIPLSCEPCFDPRPRPENYHWDAVDPPFPSSGFPSIHCKNDQCLYIKVRPRSNVVLGNTRAIQIRLHPKAFSPGYSRSTRMVF